MSIVRSRCTIAIITCHVSTSSGIHIPTCTATSQDESIITTHEVPSGHLRKDRLHARIRVSAQTGQRVCIHARRKRCDKPFKTMAGRSALQASCAKAVAGLFGVDACETTRHGQWLPTTSSGWRGKLPRPATRAAAKTKLHAPPHDSAAMDWQPERVLAGWPLSSGSSWRTEASSQARKDVR